MGEGEIIVLSRGCREKVAGVVVVEDDEEREVGDAVVVVGCVNVGISCIRGAMVGGLERVSGSSSSESSKAVISAARRLRAGREGLSWAGCLRVLEEQWCDLKQVA